MAKQVKFNKFLILEVSSWELYLHCDSPGYCDFCMAQPEVGYYIAVLNKWFCPECYEEWKERATYYEEDSYIEERNFNRMKKRLHMN